MTEPRDTTVAGGGSGERGVIDQTPHNLKQRVAQAGLVSICSQGIKFLLRTASLLVLARLLIPEDFGLVGMATAVTGFVGLFRDLGLSPATIQRTSITHAQMSTLFWINLGMGGVLTIVSIAFAPALAAFYREPRLVFVIVVLAIGFLLGGASAQHQAILQRNMRFLALSIIEISSLVLSITISVGMAAAGLGYWALVVVAISPTAGMAMGSWLVSGWLPGMPHRLSGMRSILRFGSAVTLNGVVVYIAYNAEKVLLGRFWGAETLGIYGRGYQLVNLPTENLNAAVGTVAFPALARVQNDPERLKNYFLRAYSLFMSIVTPITAACALFAEDIIVICLGSHWREAVPIFRLLTPTIVAFGLINPFSWLLLASGRPGRSLKIALMIAPIVLLGNLAGLAYGPQGVAIGNSVAMVLMIAPVIIWAKQNTLIATRAILRTLVYPFSSTLVAATAVLMSWHLLTRVEPPLLRLTLAIALLFSVYSATLLFALRQKSVYMSLLQETGLWPLGRWRFLKSFGGA